MCHHYKIYKPVGYLSQFINNQSKRRNKKLLGELHDFNENTMSIGRLDQNSEGLLLLTTDGALSYKILKGGIEKEYFVQLDGNITNTAIFELRNGIEISINGKKYLTKPCKVKRLEKPSLPSPIRPIKPMGNNATSWISITITEGKFRQVRKMTAKVGYPTLRLVRVRIGNEHVGIMKPGEVKEVKKFML
jgi:23S rRNA pseudouridine2457 synthase